MILFFSSNESGHIEKSSMQMFKQICHTKSNTYT